MRTRNNSDRPIRLFVSDIDGCLSEPYSPFRLDLLNELATLAEGIRVDSRPVGRPALSVCSGRSYPYVEAVTQMLRLETPVVFEAGGGMFDPVRSRWSWSPQFSAGLKRQIAEIRSWLQSDVMPGTAMDIDHAKKTQASLAGPIVDEVLGAVPLVEQFVGEGFPELIVAHTDISIDVIPLSLNKASGIQWLADTLGISLEEIAFIGDTNGDVPALEIVGSSFAPSNAKKAARDVAHITTNGAVIDGVLEAYRWCSSHNDLIN